MVHIGRDLNASSSLLGMSFLSAPFPRQGIPVVLSDMSTIPKSFLLLKFLQEIK